MSLDLIQTLALASLVFGAGSGVKRIVPVISRLNIPAAVVGGLTYAVLAFAAEPFVGRLGLDTSAQPLFMVAFFTSIGIGATWSLLKRGGVPVVVLLILATFLALIQNVAGIGAAWALGVHPLIGVIAGSVTLVGGPATGMAFAPSFEAAGVDGAGVLTIASATVGILFGGLCGGPVGSYLMRRRNLVSSDRMQNVAHSGDGGGVNVELDQERGSFSVSLLVLGMCMGIGSLISLGFASAGWVLPAYIGAMIAASAVANAAEHSSLRVIDLRLVRFLGGVCLNIFLVVALMNLRIADLANLAVPLTVILMLQVVIAALFTLFIVFRFMGRDYDGAVASAGFIGFGLGTTANAVANMQTLEERFGAAPRAFLTVPIVGGFFIDFTNALVINGFLNWWR